MEEPISLTLDYSKIDKSGLIKKNRKIEDCILTIYDCANALCIEALGENISPEYCKEKIQIIENDLRCLKNSLGLVENNGNR